MEYRTGSGCLCIVITLVLGLFAVQSQAEDPQIGIALLNFMKALAKDQLIWNNWNSTPDPCSESWKGIICKNKLNVSHVILEDMGLDGRIDGEALCQVKTLKVLSLKKNNLQGPIPDAISKCEQIQRIYLADNQLSGNIPTSLSALRKLIWLDVSNNKLTGPLPPFNLTGFMSFNVSNNNLSGRIPNTGDRFNSSYGGNPGLCKSPLAPCNSTISPLPSPSPFPRNYKKVSDPGLCESPLAPCNATMSPVPSPSPSPATHDRVSEIIAMWAGYIGLFFVIALFFIFIFLYKKKYFSVIEDPKEDRIGAHQMNAEKKTKDLSFTEADSRSSDYTVSLSESKSSSLIFLDSFIFTYMLERLPLWSTCCSFIMAIPILGASWLGGASIGMVYLYILCFDFLMCMGHSNVEVVPAFIFRYMSPLKYLIYTPSYHSLHHTETDTNFCLFMPMYDYLGKTINNKSWVVYNFMREGQVDRVPDFVFLAHVVDMLSSLHVPFVFRSFASTPFSTQWFLLPIWPFTVPVMFAMWAWAKPFVNTFYILRERLHHTWVIPRFGFQYFLPFAQEGINNLIEDAILSADRLGVKVISLAALNKVNKPYLPLASGEYSIATGVAIVTAFAFMSSIYKSPATLTKPLIFATAFMCFFSIVIALFKLFYAEYLLIPFVR